MKTINKTPRISIFLLIALSICSCRSKDLNIRHERNARVQQESTGLESRIKESNYTNRIIEISDSSNHQYKVRIFPLDTFSFSIDSGFKGRARSIEFSGSIRQGSDASGIIADSATKLIDEVYKQQTSSSSKEMTTTKALTKKSPGIISFWIWIGLIIVIIYVVVKFPKIKYY